MPDNASPRRTALHARHRALGANMASFAGWEMPLWYRAGAVREHLAVIQAAGLFDTSHMDVFFVEGGKAQSFLNYAFTRDLARIKPGRAIYGAFLNQKGHVIDDAILYPLDAERKRFAVVVNAGMAPAATAHLRGLPDADEVALREPAGRLGKLDIQGPASPAILRRILADADAAFANLGYFTFKGDFDFQASQIRLADQTPILLSRTGYTGELGFEIFAPLEGIGKIWDDLLGLGGDLGLLPCGLAARDSLRTGALLPLSHQDIGPWPYVNHPWRFALPLAGDGTFSFTKDFMGAAALRPDGNLHTLAFAGFDQRRVEPSGAKAFFAGEEIGDVSTIVSDMAIGRTDGGGILSLASPGKPAGWTPRGLACGFVRVKRNPPPGSRLLLRDARREIEVEIVGNIRPDRTATRRIQ
ncbi:MAG: aminomethyl transferase family protein [Planctomycetota bacterium]|jgi:aminomethyltransferase|nr:aminomethyl transferase family protein [Planctomycetota bacterium]